MRIAVASGKGGTGKTTVATNLAHVASLNGQRVAYVDCDVEEPNGHLFLRPQITSRGAAVRLVPKVDPAECTQCGLCGEICQYSAIVLVGRTVLVYPELCHACGGCVLVCPSGAIREHPREVGRLEAGHAGGIAFVHGLLNIGEAMSPPLIRQVKQAMPDAEVVLIDAPPGTSCPVIESVRGADFVLLVTEPTPFGLHDLKLAVEMVRALKTSFGIIINRAGAGDNETAGYCRANRFEIVAEIPDDRRIAEAYSRGMLATDALPEYRDLFEAILSRVSRSGRNSPAGMESAKGARR